MSDQNSQYVQRLKRFRDRHDVSWNLLADIVNVSAGTMQRYLRDPRARSHRNVDGAVIAVLDLIDDRRIDIDYPVVRQRCPRLSPQEFITATQGRSVDEVAAALNAHRVTVSNWRGGRYQPSAAASKFVRLANFFGWPA